MQLQMISTVERMDMVVRERKWQHLSYPNSETEPRRECWKKRKQHVNPREG